VGRLIRFSETRQSRQNQEFPDLCWRFAGGYIAAQVKEGTTNGGKIDILLVEDNAEHIMSTLNALKKANVCNKIHVVRDAAEMFDFLFRTGAYAKQGPLSPDTLILLSLNLSGTHGLDLLRKIKADERTKSLPVIMMTSSQEERGVMQSYKLGASGCIVKPIDLPKFVEAVSELRLGWVLVMPENGEQK
jgi:two-component system response regulator